MASLNKILVIGRLGRDPEVKMTPTGTKVASFSVATSERYNDAQGNKQEKTEWISVVAWKRLAEIIEKYVKKGDMIYVEGKLTTRSWDDQQGQKRYRTEVVAKSIQMLGGRGEGGGQASGGYGQQSGVASTGGATAPAEDFGSLPSDEDLPF